MVRNGEQRWLMILMVDNVKLRIEHCPCLTVQPAARHSQDLLWSATNRKTKKQLRGDGIDSSGRNGSSSSSTGISTGSSSSTGQQ